MMRVDLYGGFGEKGRTSVGVSANGYNILLDTGIMVGAKGRDYYPLIDADAIRKLDAVFVSHAHEDHIGGLGWLLDQGFGGEIFMTHETWGEARDMLEQYAEPEHMRNFPPAPEKLRLFRPGRMLEAGPLRVSTGRSGHVAGGVWFGVDDGSSKAVYCADVVSHSNVLAMDMIPRCDLVILDASYGADPVSGEERGNAIGNWIASRPAGCLLPVPLSGKPLELMAILPERFAIHASMREAISTQISADNAFVPAIRQKLLARLRGALDWNDGDAFPDCPLMTFDGMGSAGPSVDAIARAAAQDLPVLLTGHIPAATPARELYEAGRASWIRLPTHPTRQENVEMWEAAGRPAALGHSCPLSALDDLKPFLPSLNTAMISGQHLEL